MGVPNRGCTTIHARNLNMGLRARLDRIENNAHSTMGEAKQMIAFAKGLIEEIGDGVDIELVREGEDTIMDFIQGKTNVLPFRLRLKIDE
jgi:hypothetical protein